ncbi:2-phospho-L-lactate guanylyltransferase [Pelotomaculum schinkii]|uniref:2-phospho-L-lactate guanylyltransferase n=1 Tax=Pelotomaculum schinkii TaxID=78350 RepID=A0A4Y7RJE8_9FIRM|nr:nucleotidyltransferase family protein [Pelotomaculum schinkii]TEB08447.1 2-phospho-L-lactate guanylyltransferase [Pelotomaculum schinkii]
MVDAVVLAGSSNEGPLRECSEVRYEALIPIGEKIMVQYVVEALLRCRQIRRVVVVGPVAELSPFFNGERVSVIESRGGIMENIEAGLKSVLGAGRVLLVTSDIPMLTTQAVNDFLELCGDMSGDLYYPIISKQVVESKFPTTRRTYVNLKEGVFTGGNLFLINPAIFKQCVENGQKIISLRKSPVGLCRLIGLGFVLKFLMRSLTIAEAEQKASQLLGMIKGIVVMSKYPEVGVDVDKPADLTLALKTLGA